MMGSLVFMTILAAVRVLYFDEVGYHHPEAMVYVQPE